MNSPPVKSPAVTRSSPIVSQALAASSSSYTKLPRVQDSGTAALSPSSLNAQFLHSVAVRLAPEIRLHPKEDLYPCSVEWCLGRSQVVYSAQAVQKQRADDVVLLERCGVAALASQSILGDQSGFDPLQPKTAPYFYLRYADGKQGRQGQPAEQLPDVPVYYQVVEVAELGQYEFRYWFLFGCRSRRLALFADASEGAHWQYLSVYVQLGSRYGTKILRVYYPAGTDFGNAGWWYIQKDAAAGYQLTDDNHPVAYCSLRNHYFYARPGSYSRGILHSNDVAEDGGTSWQTWRSPLLRIPLSGEPVPSPGPLSFLLYAGRWSPADAENAVYGPLLTRQSLHSTPPPSPNNTQPPDPDDHENSGLKVDEVHRVRLASLVADSYFRVRRWLPVPCTAHLRSLHIGRRRLDVAATADPLAGRPLLWAVDRRHALYLFDEHAQSWIDTACRVRTLSCGHDATVLAIAPPPSYAVYRLTPADFHRIASLLSNASSDQPAAASLPVSPPSPPPPPPSLLHQRQSPGRPFTEEADFEPLLDSPFGSDNDSDDDNVDAIQTNDNSSHQSVDVDDDESVADRGADAASLSQLDRWELVPGVELRDVAVADSATIWGVTVQHQIVRYQASDGSWTPIPSPLDDSGQRPFSVVQVAVGVGAVWARASSGEVFRYQSEQWVQMPGRLRFIAVGGFTAVWGIDAVTRKLLRWTGSEFESMGELADFVCGNSEGALWSLVYDDDVDNNASHNDIASHSHIENDGQNHIENDDQNHIENDDQNHIEKDDQNHIEKDGQNHIENDDSHSDADQSHDEDKHTDGDEKYSAVPLVMRRACQTLSVTPVQEFQKLWDNGPNAPPGQLHISVFRPVPPPGYYTLGDYIERTWLADSQGVALAVAEQSDAPYAINWQPLLAPPKSFEVVWSTETASRFGQLCFWRPVAPDGYASLGFVTTPSPQLPPSAHMVRCVHLGLVKRARVRYASGDGPLWACGNLSLWSVDRVLESISPGTFHATTLGHPFPDAFTRTFFALDTEAHEPDDAASVEGGGDPAYLQMLF